MTRFEFYAKSLIIFMISACFIALADNKKDMMWHLNWGVITILAYFIWHDCPIFPKGFKSYMVGKLFGTEANPQDQRAASAPPASSCSTAGNVEGKIL